MQIRAFIRAPLWTIAIALLCGCGRSAPRIDLASLLDQLNDPLLPARLDVPGARLASSFDPTGGNEDADHFVRPGPDGWVVLADLKGPGYVSRFWMTGAHPEYRLRFHFDHETEPRLETTLAEYCGGRAPFLPPLAGSENFASYSYFPLPFARRLVVMGESPQTGKPLYFHVNHTGPLQGVRVESLPREFDEALLSRVRTVCDEWSRRSPMPAAATLTERVVTLRPGETVELEGPPGPAVVRRLRVRLDPEAKLTARPREHLLRDVVVQFEWDVSGQPSVEAPLGSFFGVPWYPVAFQSALFGTEDGFLEQHLPMPYRASACLRFRNEGSVAVDVQAQLHVVPLPEWDVDLGYLHTEWRTSGPELTQGPHVVADIEGEAKLAACQLSVWSAEESWLCLEGDERIAIDGQPPESVWHGTGLEDYFNGGWYYQRVLARPNHGVTGLAPFRTSQYRLHRLDAPRARSGLRMEIERGPFNSMEGVMESAAFFYRRVPGAVAAVGTRTDGSGEAETVMWDLLGLERLGDTAGARQRLRAILEAEPDHPEAELLRLREIGYVRVLSGDSVARPLYEAFLATAKDDRARDQCRLMLRFMDDPEAGLLALFSNTPATAYLDGEAVGMGGNSSACLFFPVRVTKGRHVLSVSAKDRSPPAWVLACLLTHAGTVSTDPSWRWAQDPPDESWRLESFKDSGWPILGGTGTRGPPEEPYRLIRPDGMVGMQSQALGIWPETSAPDPNATFGFRKAFEQPNPP